MSTYTVADYLLDRLAESGVRHLFGVPGDFTLAFLDHVERHPLIEWVGCANELGAGYAADGYARLHGLGALSTTFGVGELSAISAVAGSFAEHVPVLHVVGAPTTAVQAAGRASHHSLGDGDFGHFARMTAEVTAAHEVLSATDATTQIDRVLAEVRHRRLPGYLLIPADVSEAPASPPAAALPAPDVVTDPAVLARFRDALGARLEVADSVSVLADILVARLSAEPSLHRVLAQGVPHASLLWGRRVVDESAPAYLGSYLGAASAPAVRDGIETADLLVMAGVQFTDLTSGFFSQRIDPARTVEIRGEHTRVGDDDFRPLAMRDALDAVADALAAQGDRFRAPAVDVVPAAREPLDPSATLSQTALWREIAGFLRDGDTVLADQGTSFYGMAGERLPHGVVFGGQPLWAAIGFTLPAILGAALARPERRPVLLIGDGAAQLTVGELGTLVRQGIPAVIVVVDNAGYTVERVIHGLHERYNDIATWDWTALLAAMDPTGTSVGVRVDTVGALTEALATARSATGLTLVQAVVPSDDVPPVLADLASAAAAANRRA
ncbi:alpha-keto acid decarboxylase family protein [Microbacterium sp. CFBP 13617]|uniref:alpha-keto acid decarboxylase family protein n=1 Tax=Microbacterium sp. CFBP 13617 TaxID=2774035 RepID=UPI001783D714|nr:thiamine pyrophosphate-binding protein [Microbacterium sp. CFBP 13617]MBD8219772.1 alpha-keto acid decarboxylase family protein [Microbacterium sp. CFBP 13617]